VELSSTVLQLLQRVIKETEDYCNTEIEWLNENNSLHISLSKPLYPRAAARAQLGEAVSEVAKHFSV